MKVQKMSINLYLNSPSHKFIYEETLQGLNLITKSLYDIKGLFRWSVFVSRQLSVLWKTFIACPGVNFRKISVDFVLFGLSVMFVAGKKIIFWAFYTLVLLDVAYSNSITIWNNGNHPATLECASVNSSIGPYEIQPNSLFQWSFNDNSMCTTRFWCDLDYNGEWYHWDVYKCGSGARRTVWEILDDGIYDGNYLKVVSF